MVKYSVIIPTLWKSNRTRKLILDLVECQYVDEIIIIDNSNMEECDKLSNCIGFVTQGVKYMLILRGIGE